jgi:hypothetical protein
MNNKTKTKTTEALSLICLGVCLFGSLALFAYQVVHYTTLLG